MNKLQDHTRNRFINKLVSLCESYDYPYIIRDAEIVVEIGE